MKGKERHFFPGSNTPKGFFSYFNFILEQKEAERIICLKGGPGVGKSTFMKSIGDEMIEKGYDVDFMHCSSDPDSLDAIMIRELKVAVIDGTAPHIVDPRNPGAVDMIINLGDYWKEEGIRENKEEILKCTEVIKSYFECAYNYIKAAKSMYDNMNSIYEMALLDEALHKTSERLVDQEFSCNELREKKGSFKKHFASAITPDGIVNYISTIIEGYDRIYLFDCPVGMGPERVMEILKDNALYRGFDVEAFYCPMVPDTKIEHLLIPEKNTAFITSNSYLQSDADVYEFIYMHDFINWKGIERYKELLDNSQRWMDELLEKGIECINNSRKIHNVLEDYYIPHMNFKAIDKCRKALVKKYLLKNEMYKKTEIK